MKELKKKEHISSQNELREEFMKKKLQDKYRAQEQMIMDSHLKKQEDVLGKKILSETRRQSH